MNLRDAIQQAARFAWKGKPSSLLKGIRFLPAVPGTPARLYANNGPLGVLIDLDIDQVPNVLIDAEKAAKVAKAEKGPMSIGPCQGGVTLDGISLENIDNVGSYPSLPEIPQRAFTSCPDWPLVDQLLHTTSKDKQQPHLMALHFTPAVVEATDRMRVAQLFVEYDWTGLVPAEAFKNWPKGGVSYAFTEEMAVFKIGDELRFSMKQRGTFPEVGKLLIGNRLAVAVETEELAAVVKKIASLVGQVELSFCTVCGEPLKISGGGASEELLAHFVYEYEGSPQSGSVSVSSRWLLETLKVIRTQRVVVSCGPCAQDPLLIESGAFVEGIWPINVYKE